MVTPISRFSFWTDFETDITTVYDLDMNRVGNDCITERCRSKAIYGAKAANGVVVIEPVSRKPGR